MFINEACLFATFFLNLFVESNVGRRFLGRNIYVRQREINIKFYDNWKILRTHPSKQNDFSSFYNRWNFVFHEIIRPLITSNIDEIPIGEIWISRSNLGRGDRAMVDLGLDLVKIVPHSPRTSVLYYNSLDPFRQRYTRDLLRPFFFFAPPPSPFVTTRHNSSCRRAQILW